MTVTRSFGIGAMNVESPVEVDEKTPCIIITDHRGSRMELLPRDARHLALLLPCFDDPRAFPLIPFKEQKP